MLSKNLVEEPPIRSVGGDTGSFASRMLAIGVVSVQCPPWLFNRDPLVLFERKTKSRRGRAPVQKGTHVGYPRGNDSNLSTRIKRSYTIGAPHARLTSR